MELGRATAPTASAPGLALADPATLLLIAWVWIGAALAMSNGAYLPHAVALLTLGLVAVVAAGVRVVRGGVVRLPTPGVLAAATAALAVSFLYAPGMYATGPWVSASRVLTLAAVTAGVGVVMTQGRRAVNLLVTAVVAASGGAMVLMIKASPSPHIDVWYILTNGAQDVLHRVDIYRACWPGNTDRLTDCVYPYLPMTSVVQVPFRYLGDVRYSYVAALLVCSAAMVGLAGRRALPVVVLLLVSPKLTFLVEQAWTEPLLLAGVATFVWAASAGRRTTAVLALAFALASKQHVLLLVPLAAVWPAFGWRRTAAAVSLGGLFTAAWVAVDVRAFLRDAWDFNLHLPPRADSLSLFTTATRHGWGPSFAVVAAVTVLAIAVSVVVLPRTASGFCLGAAFVQYVFDLANKQSFFNHWWFVSGLLLLAVACLFADAESGGEPGASAVPVDARPHVVGEQPAGNLEPTPRGVAGGSPEGPHAVLHRMRE